MQSRLAPLPLSGKQRHHLQLSLSRADDTIGIFASWWVDWLRLRAVSAGYASMGIDLRFAGGLLAAPAGLLFAKLLIPKPEYR